VERAAREQREEHAQPHEPDRRDDGSELVRDGRHREERCRGDDESDLLHDQNPDLVKFAWSFATPLFAAGVPSALDGLAFENSFFISPYAFIWLSIAAIAGGGATALAAARSRSLSACSCAARVTSPAAYAFAASTLRRDAFTLTALANTAP